MEKKFKQYLEEARNPNKSKLEAFMEAISAMRKLKKFKDYKSFEQEVNSEMKGIEKMVKNMVKNIEQTVMEVNHTVAELLMTGFDMSGPADENEDMYMASLDKATKLIGKLEDAADIAREFDFDGLKKQILAGVDKNNSKYHDDEADKASKEITGK